MKSNLISEYAEKIVMRSTRYGTGQTIIDKNIKETESLLTKMVEKVIGQSDTLHWQDLEDAYGDETGLIVHTILVEQRARAGLKGAEHEFF